MNTNLQRFSGAWETKQLKELGPFSKGRGIKRDHVTDEGVPCVRYGELYTRYKNYISKIASRIPPEVAATALPIKNGDLLFAGSGETAEEIGRCAAYLGEEQAYAGGDVIVLTPSGQNSIYLGHLMNSPIVSTQKARLAQGDAVVHIYINNLAEVKIELPPITEQNAIAKILSDVDGLLNALESLIAKKQAIKQAVMLQLLTGRTRLPGFNGEWETMQMRRIGAIYGGLSGKSKVDFARGYSRYVTFLGVLENIILDVRHTERVYVDRGESQNSVMKGDILFNASSETPGDLALGAVMGEQLDNLYLNSFCFGFRISGENRHVPLFLAYYFRGFPGRAIMNALAQGATRYNLSKSQFLTLELSIPSCNEQYAIASVLSDMDTEIAALELRLHKTRAIKLGMLQQLLTGRTRLIKTEVED
ncbi:MAG: restriction endonuclease subunit S [Candidatus Poribacteria bacterium]|nr:restriction endonuclease subunit S [Candidatus Poribacteria bacterium]